jgi:hypothetical protein
MSKFEKLKPILGWLAVVFISGLVHQKIIPPELGVVLAGAVKTWLPTLGKQAEP